MRNSLGLLVCGLSSQERLVSYRQLKDYLLGREGTQMTEWAKEKQIRKIKQLRVATWNVTPFAL